jgi:hypothetical protein
LLLGRKHLLLCQEVFGHESLYTLFCSQNLSLFRQDPIQVRILGGNQVDHLRPLCTRLLAQLANGSLKLLQPRLDFCPLFLGDF